MRKIFTPIYGKCTECYNSYMKNKAPLYSINIACGLFGISDDFIDSYLSLDEKFLKNKESVFFVRATGNSMSPEIKSGDILIVDRSQEVRSKDIVAIYLNGQALCKKIIYEPKLLLHSINESYKDYIIRESDELIIFGKVIGLARDF